jgi:hypothetical protein
MHKPETNDPIEKYLALAERRLCRNLYADHVSAILAEAKDHMTERADELVANGMEREQALVTAALSFGDVREWTGSIVQSAYADAFTGKWRVFSVCACAVLLSAPLMESQMPSSGEYNECFLLFVASVMGLVAIGSFCARHWAPKVLIATGLLLSIAGFIVSGFTMVSLSGSNMVCTRQDMLQKAHIWSRMIVGEQRELDLLRIGQQTYGTGRLPSAVPAVLCAPNGYIVPRPTNQVSHGEQYYPTLWPSAFKRPALMSQVRDPMSFDEMGRLEDAAPYYTVSNIADAAQAWQSDGSLNVGDLNANLHGDMNLRDGFLKAAARRARFDVRAGTQMVQVTAVTTAFTLILNGIFAGVGRFIFRVRRRRAQTA